MIGCPDKLLHADAVSHRIGYYDIVDTEPKRVPAWPFECYECATGIVVYERAQSRKMLFVRR